MALIKSISGIRGTIGEKAGYNLTPIDIVECTAGFGTWIINNNYNKKVVVGRDGRISGDMVSQLAIQTLIGMGIDVIDLGLSTTPTVEIMVSQLCAGAGIIFTASHNPKQWNALKFLNHKGEFISAKDGSEIIEYIADKSSRFADIDHLGSISNYSGGIDKHISMILEMAYVDAQAIKSKNFHVVVDCINSTGAISIPPLLDKLGVKYTLINETLNGNFAHNPEPLAEHLKELSSKVIELNADLGISVDPDVDRLAFVNEDGNMFGEEYTLVAVADYILSINKGNTVSNLSSTRALADITVKHGGIYNASAVGEVNVVELMKKTDAIVGGEGNGGIIIPSLHYGRDALAGIAIFLTHLAQSRKSMSQLKSSYPVYHMVKDKVSIAGLEISSILDDIISLNKDFPVSTIDGVKIDYEDGWVHIRKSNTEEVIRIYAESLTIEKAEHYIQKIKKVVH
jgi:phosphomannomutase